MHRRAFIGGLAISLSVATQAARKVPRIGVLRWGTPDDGSQARLREALGAKGYREGRNIAIDWRWATRNEDAARHATELVQSGVDVIDRADEFENAFSMMASERAQAVIVQPLFTPHAQALADLAQRHRLPLIAAFPSFVRAGGLMSYGPSSAAITERTVVYVEKILHGAKPGDLPIEEPTRFELHVNLKAARPLGVTIPRSLLVRADEVIQ